MQNLRKVSAFMLFAVLLFSAPQINAQIVSNSCQANPAVGTNCVGACGLTSSINYTYTFCNSFVSKFCVVNDASNLCPTHAAKAAVYVNGVLEATGDITAVGSSISFKAVCGDNIVVKVAAVPVISPIQCIQLGNLNYSLRRAL